MDDGKSDETKRALLLAVVPLGMLNVPGLFVFPILMLVIGADNISLDRAVPWVAGVWLGGLLQGVVLATRQRWWRQLSVHSWEVAYAGVEVVIGVSWASALVIGNDSMNELSTQMLVIAFLVMMSAAAVIACAGSRMIGRTFLISQWLTVAAITLARSEFRLAALAGVICAVALVYGDVTHRVLAQSVQARLRSNDLAEQLAHQANTDSLTGLWNRLAILQALQAMIDDGRTPTVLFIDLDGFKDINDEFGHAHGDAVLVDLADRLRSTVRSNDMVGRLGGDEFVILLPGELDPIVQNRLSQQIVDAVSEPFGQSPSVAVTASIGLSQARAGDRADRVLSRADLAMYAAKNGGGDMTLVFESEHEDQRLAQLDIRRELRTAIAEGMIEAYAQPIVDLADASTTSYELLARWTRPNGDMVLPVTFVGLAEELELDRDLGCLMLDHAARAASLTDVRFGVNITANHLLSGQLLDDLVNASRRHGIDYSMLIVEITESQVLTDIERAIDEIQRVQNLGVTVAIDDFGTGNSSLACLERLPASWLKLAPDFGLRVSESWRATRVVGQVAQLANDLQFKLVAEGIETTEVLDEMRAAGITTGQGFLFAKPRPLDEIVTMVRGGGGPTVGEASSKVAAGRR